MSAQLSYVKSGYAARLPLAAAIAKRDGGWSCFYCAKEFVHGIDHVTAKFHGGSDSIENLVLCCWPCNFEKNTTPGWLFAIKKLIEGLEPSYQVLRLPEPEGLPWERP